MKRIVLKAAEGMVFTNGQVFGKTVYPSDNDSPENWYEIRQEEYERIMKERESLDE